MSNEKVKSVFTSKLMIALMIALSIHVVFLIGLAVYCFIQSYSLPMPEQFQAYIAGMSSPEELLSYQRSMLITEGLLCFLFSLGIITPCLTGLHIIFKNRNLKSGFTIIQVTSMIMSILLVLAAVCVLLFYFRYFSIIGTFGTCLIFLPYFIKFFSLTVSASSAKKNLSGNDFLTKGIAPLMVSTIITFIFDIIILLTAISYSSIFYTIGAAIFAVSDLLIFAISFRYTKKIDLVQKAVKVYSENT